MIELTLQQIVYWGEDLETTLLRIDSNKMVYPTRPNKPILKSNHTKEDVLKYAEDLENYNSLSENYKKEYDIVREFNQSLNNLKEDFIKDYSGLNDVVPQIYRDKVWNLAYQLGHSNGYYETYLKLSQLIEIFE